MKTFLPCAIFIAILACPTEATAQTNQWPQFRGPTGDGQAVQTQAGAANVPTTIDSSVVTWSTPIHGKGWSSPVVWDNKIWLTTATEDGQKMSVVCVDATSGKILIDKVVCENPDPAFCHPMNSYATPTPILEAGRVYVHFGSYLTACLDMDTAETIWERRDLECDHHRGPASSPIIHGNKLFVAYDGFDVQYVVALDKNTGKTIWKTDRDIDYGTDNGDRMKAYCTGHIINVDGKEQLVYPSAVATIAYAPETGKAIWTAYHDGMNASARPIYHDGLVFITNGMGSMVAVAANGKGDVTGTHIAWSANKGVAKKSSQLIVDGLLYMISDDGIATCRDPKTGDLHWQKRIGGSYAASPVYAGGKLYLFSIEGNVTTLQPGIKFLALAESTLGDGFMASAAVVGDAMILRSKSALYRVENK
ncbi:PQQ-binding-like beta-propeller repeat protein [Planctomycetes bacterium K23_9]|uniref:Outer membrane biogenesis protein BamB n=1 Tax=Stieleria marina TaxID=1930275 RepID=A0A517NMU6_9BACT|nr:outer membrane biogenesis protein BamB [Planctomycetes bacterium K23_9]